MVRKLLLAASLALAVPFLPAPQAAADGPVKPTYQVLARKGTGSWFSAGMTGDPAGVQRIAAEVRALGYQTQVRVLGGPAPKATPSPAPKARPTPAPRPATRPATPTNAVRPPTANVPLVGTWQIKLRTDAGLGQEFTMEVVSLKGSTFTFRVPYHGQGQGTYDAAKGAIRFTHNGKAYSGNVRPSANGGWYMGGFISTGDRFPIDWSGNRQ